jgi:hypothetical protein
MSSASGKEASGEKGATDDGRDELGRRVWDKDAFESKAKERARAEEEAADTSKKGSILAVKRDLLKGREAKVDLDSRLGKSRVVDSAHAAASGYHCKVRSLPSIRSVHLSAAGVRERMCTRSHHHHNASFPPWPLSARCISPFLPSFISLHLASTWSTLHRCATVCFLPSFISFPSRLDVVHFAQVCDCVLRDSINYLDHINGKKREPTS